MQKVYLFGIALLLAFASLSFASAGVPDEAIIRTIPAQSIWVADGVTEYRVDVYADTTPVSSQLTRGINWRVMPPQGLQSNIVMTRSQLPLQSGLSDFFNNGTTLDNGFGSLWGVDGRLTSPPNWIFPRQGYVASYWFKVMPGVGKTSTSFTLNNVAFNNPTNGLIPHHVENVPFTVIPRQATYTNAVVCDDLSC